MSLNAPVNNELFTVRTRKFLVNNPETDWVNDYTVAWLSETPGGYADITVMLDYILAFEEALHLSPVIIDKAVISTYLADSDPYDANEFISYPYNQAGNRGSTGDPLPLDYTLRLRKGVPTGHYGRVGYRGVLSEGEVESFAGSATLSNVVTWQNNVANAVSASNFAQILAGGAENFRLVVTNSGGPSFRIVLNIGSPSASITKYRRPRRRANGSI